MLGSELIIPINVLLHNTVYRAVNDYFDFALTVVVYTRIFSKVINAVMGVSVECQHYFEWYAGVLTSI